LQKKLNQNQILSEIYEVMLKALELKITIDEERQICERRKLEESRGEYWFNLTK
jgi:hypothetical protein